MPTALIIGASRGLGRGLVEEHLKRGWDVIATVRKPDALHGVGNGHLKVETLDTTDWAGVDALGETLSPASLDLLFGLRSSVEMVTFVREQLGPLLDERDARASELLRTLEIYLEKGGRKAEAARALHLERQSLYGRLERIERTLEAPLDDPDTILGLHLAIRALRLMEADGERPRPLP